MTDPIGLLSLVISVGLIVASLRQFLPLLRTLRKANMEVRPAIPDAELPEARVFLCLRGTDPFLDRCLNGLATQNYPSWKIIIVVDSAEDEALPQALDLQEKYGPDRVDVILRKYQFPTCSRRASSFVTGLEQLEDNVDAIVLCDGDTVPHKNWLRDLMRPLLNGARATSGCRWYVPGSLSPGSHVRYCWNAMALPCMYTDGIIWAGSMAISREVFRDPQFLTAIKQSFSEDTKLAGFLRERGHRITPQPDIPVLNAETVTMSACWGFLVRQMLAAKLHHPAWPSVFCVALLMGFEMWILLPLSVYRGHTVMLMWLLGILMYGTVTQTCVGLCEWQIRRFVRATRQQAVAPFGLKRAAMWIPAFVLLGLIYPIAVLTAAFTKTHVWRGVTYDIFRDSIRLSEPALHAVKSSVPTNSP